jgi:hypothetical protein
MMLGSSGGLLLFEFSQAPKASLPGLPNFLFVKASNPSSAPSMNGLAAKNKKGVGLAYDFKLVNNNQLAWLPDAV